MQSPRQASKNIQTIKTNYAALGYMHVSKSDLHSVLTYTSCYIPGEDMAADFIAF